MRPACDQDSSNCAAGGDRADVVFADESAHPLHDLHVRTSSEPERGSGVPQIVDPQVG
jgi:hypothetical protein